MAVVPSGRIVYRQDFKKKSYFIGKITPEERVEVTEYDGAELPVITGDPAYFNLTAPRPFDNAKVRYVYRRTEKADLPIIETGVLADGKLWRYDLKPVENAAIDLLSMVWDKIEDKGLMLLQSNNAQRKYLSIDEFIYDPPDRETVAVYNTDLDKEFEIKNYEPSDGPKRYDIGIRGNHQIYAYIGEGEKLYFKFGFYDLNENKDPDPVDIDIYYGGALLDSRRLEDDGVTEDNGRKSAVREAEISLAGLPKGVYKLDLRVNDDIAADYFETSQRYFSFVNRLRLFGTGGPLSVFTDSREIRAQTTDPSALQEITAGGSKILIEETYKQYGAQTAGTSSRVSIAKPSLVLAGEGVFAFSEDSITNPALKRVAKADDISHGNVKYVLAGYRIPETMDGWTIAETEFDLKNAYRENGKYGFIVSIPGLESDGEKSKTGIIIKEIEIELFGKSLREKILEKFKSFFPSSSRG